ncbi:glycosyltransferase family 25 protein [Vibrio splendidus]|uniref:glycosyltransferase family 25 protein n=1 Tax=Vibrio splendidus TaxID=29497 RepID=UPI0002EE52D2|nr:glycosyltransferase family 25 protein [Vibrio splendidus]
MNTEIINPVKIKVVSLKQSRLRRNISNQIRSLDYDFFDAITDNTSRLFCELQAQEKYQRELKKGEIGCALSHYSLMKEHADKVNNDWMIILEDDALIESGFECFIEDLSTVKCDNACILLLGHSKTRKKDLWVQRLKQPLSDIIDIGDKCFGINSRIGFCGTVGYAINRKAATLITNNKLCWIADDWKTIKKSGVDIYHPKEPLIYEDLNTESSIGNRIFFNHHLGTNTLRQILSIVKAQVMKRI